MAELNLKVHDKNDQILFDYIKSNASDALIERINAGTKSLAQCWNYIKTEAKKQVINGCACIEDKTVFGWAMHFFEEDSIKGEGYEKSPTGAVVKTASTKEEKPEAPKVKKVVKPKVDIASAEQIGFDFFG